MDKSGIERQAAGQEDLISPQYGNRTLSDLKQSVQSAAMQLFAQSLPGGLAGIYLAERYPVYFISDTLLESLGYTYESFMESCRGSFLGVVEPEDHGAYISAVQCWAGESGGRHEAAFRIRHGGGAYRWMRAQARRIVTEERREALLLLLLDVTEEVGVRLELENKARLFEEKSRRLSLLTANIPGGMCEVLLDQGFILRYGNEGFYQLLGYTPVQLEQECAGRLLAVIVAEDRDLVRRVVDEAIRAGGQVLEFEHRLCRRDGTVVWVLVRGNISDDAGEMLMNCVVIDITDRKQMEQELRINEERFRIALAQTDNTIFDYEIETKTMIHGDRSADLYGLKQRTENVPDSLVEMGVIHPDSANAFLEMYAKIHSGVETASCVIRARTAGGEYVWRKISLTSVFSNEGKPVRAVGILEDIDAQTRLEQELRYQSERDALTNLYNRGATESRVTQRLAARQEDRLDALLVLDIDAFKAINDQYGHMFGDYVLAESARRIAGLFHSQDVIGRIGGDEFMIFMSQIPSASTAYRRAQRVCSAFKDPFNYNGATALVSCSLGIGFCPQDGNTFPELYQRADIALYEAKRTGKNRCVLFRPELFDGSEWQPYSSTAIDQAE